ncbi:MAG TPA: DUF805 domain-containing protein [Sulfurovum sp.]|nr:DUF805 domain-containing protein [Sulfurovum sp.]
MEQFNRYFIETIKNRYAKFDGRASRSEYWFYTLFYLIIAIAVGMVDTAVVNPMLGIAPEQAAQGGILQFILALALLVPSIAIGVRRLHDTGKSGWWLLIGLIPIVGALVLIFFYVTDSQAGSNMYGENPKGV